MRTAATDSPATRRRPSTTPDQWHARTEAPLTATAVLFLVVYSWSVLADLQGDLEEAAEWVMWSLWFVFVVDYVVRLLLAEHRLHWFATHLLQFLMVALPVLRPLRLLRLLMLFDVLRRATGELMRGRVTVYVAGSAAMLVTSPRLPSWRASGTRPVPTSSPSTTRSGGRSRRSPPWATAIACRSRSRAGPSRSA